MATLNENIARVKADFRAIKGELVNKGASIPSGTPTSQYANIIKEMSTGSSEEAYEQGRQDVISNSKYIPKTATGKVINLTDVSEVAHKVNVYGDNQEVTVYGNNLLPYPYYETTKTQSGLTFTDNGDGSITVNGTATALTNFAFVDRNTFTLPAGTYGFSLTPQVSGSYYLVSGNIDAGAIINYVSGNRVMTTKGELSVLFVLQIQAGVTLDNVTFYPQIKAGDVSDYEPYTKQTITATPSGTEIDSMCPNMNFFADGELDILVEYFSSFGMQTEYDRFWDGYQNNGARTNYNRLFAGEGWTDATFSPKYDMKIKNGTQTFYSTRITDLVGLLKKRGVKFSTAGCTSMANMFSSKAITTAPLVDVSSATPNSTAVASMFYDDTSLVSIEGIVSSETTPWKSDVFRYCVKLTHCIFSGVIANDINLQWSPLLDEESLQSLTQSLADFIMVGNNPTGTNIAEGQAFTKTITLSPESWAILDNLEFIPPEGSGYPTGFTCTNIITTAKGWNKA